MSHPMSAIRSTALPLAPIPESSPAIFQQPLPCTNPSASLSPSATMTTNHHTSLLGGMPCSFWWTPDNAVAAFSTYLGKYPKRQLPTTEPWPVPILRSNMHHDVQKKAASLVKKFPDLARTIEPITEWYHLYKYFDAYDLWIEGAAFCFFVIHRIGTVNREVLHEQCGMIEEFAKDWVASHEELILNNPQTRDAICLFNEADMCNLIDMREDEIRYLRDRLDHHRHLLIGKVTEVRRRAAAQTPAPILERAPPGMIVPYPGIIYPPPPHGFSQGLPMVDPQRTSVHSPAQAVSSSHQTYHQFVENQRNLASRFDPRVPPSNARNGNYNRPMESRPRGWSNDTARNGRGGRANGFFNGNPNQNGRRWVPATPRASPPRKISPSEPIYVLTSQQLSPQNQAVNGSQRVCSEPINPRDTVPRTSQRAFSDSPAGRGTIKDESVTGTSAGRRASINDFNPPSNYFTENMVPSQKSPSRVVTSGRSTPRATLSNDARVLEAIEKQDRRGSLVSQPPEPRSAPTLSNNGNGNEEPHLITFGNGGSTHTYFYAGPPRKVSRAEQGSRTVYVGHVPYDLFRDHTLKQILSECGDVDNISYLVDSRHSFVAFVEESSVLRAVQKFNGYQLGPNRLTVNLPRSRTRADSYSSQRSFTSTRTVNFAPRDNDYRPPSRRPSFREPYNHHARTFSRQSVDTPISPPSRIEGKLISSVSEVIQHNAALNRMGSQIPLGSIENHYGRNPIFQHYDYRSNESFSQTGHDSRKENSPMKSDRPPMTLSRKSSFSSQAGGKNKRPKGSRQNSGSTSARQTPAATPTKSRSEGLPGASIQGSKPVSDSKAVMKEEKSTSIPADDTNFQAGQENMIADKPKPKRKTGKKKKNAFKNESEVEMPMGSNISFATSSSDAFELMSPVGTESSIGFMTSNSTSTSWSTLPSRKPSVVSSASTPPMTEIPEDNDNIAMKAKSPKTPDIDKKSTTPKAFQSSSKNPKVEAKPRSAPSKSHSKNDSVVSTTSTTSSSLRKADAKSQSTPAPKQAKINLDDQKEFPALGPLKSPVSAISDRKCSPEPAQKAPVTPTLAERVVSGGAENQVKAAMPIVAVPRSYMPRPQPVLREGENTVGSREWIWTNRGGKPLGSKTWPFVKKVRAK